MSNDESVEATEDASGGSGPSDKVRQKIRAAEAEAANQIFKERLATPRSIDPLYTLSGPMTAGEIRACVKAMAAAAEAEAEKRAKPPKP